MPMTETARGCGVHLRTASKGAAELALRRGEFALAVHLGIVRVCVRQPRRAARSPSGGDRPPRVAGRIPRDAAGAGADRGGGGPAARDQSGPPQSAGARGLCRAGRVLPQSPPGDGVALSRAGAGGACRALTRTHGGQQPPGCAAFWTRVRTAGRATGAPAGSRGCRPSPRTPGPGPPAWGKRWTPFSLPRWSTIRTSVPA